MKLHQLALAVSIAALPVTGAFAAALDRSGQPMNAFFQEGNYFEAGLSVLDPTVSGKEANNNAAQNRGVNRDITDIGDSYMFPTAALKLQPHEKVSVALLYDQPLGADAAYSGTHKFASNPTETALLTGALTNRVMQTAQNQAMEAVVAGLNASGISVTQEQVQGILANPNHPLYARVSGIVNTAQTQATTRATLGLQDVLQKKPNNPDPNIDATSVEVHTQSLSLVAGYQPTKNWNIYAGPV